MGYLRDIEGTRERGTVGLWNWPLALRMKWSYSRVSITASGGVGVPLDIRGPQWPPNHLGSLHYKDAGFTRGQDSPVQGLAVSSCGTVISPVSLPKAAAVYRGTAGQVGHSGISLLHTGGLTPAGGFPRLQGQHCLGCREQSPRCIHSLPSGVSPEAGKPRPFPHDMGQIAPDHCPAFSAGLRDS